MNEVSAVPDVWLLRRYQVSPLTTRGRACLGPAGGTVVVVVVVDEVEVVVAPTTVVLVVVVAPGVVVVVVLEVDVVDTGLTHEARTAMSKSLPAVTRPIPKLLASGNSAVELAGTLKEPAGTAPGSPVRVPDTGVLRWLLMTMKFVVSEPVPQRPLTTTPAMAAWAGDIVTNPAATIVATHRVRNVQIRVDRFILTLPPASAERVDGKHHALRHVSGLSPASP